MKERKPLDGKRFGQLVVVRSIGKGKLLCQCDCGNTAEINRSNLVSGRQVSCGCYARKVNAERMKTHGQSNTKLYRVWRGMITRCTNPKFKSHEQYGGRGISVCEEWRRFDSFYKWAMESGYKEGLQLDRENNDGNYEPSNCSWVTQKENENNRRDTIYVEYNGEKKPLSVLAEEHGMKRSVLYDRLYKYGFTVQDALALPVKVGNNQSLRGKEDSK